MLIKKNYTYSYPEKFKKLHFEVYLKEKGIRKYNEVAEVMYLILAKAYKGDQGWNEQKRYCQALMYRNPNFYPHLGHGYRTWMHAQQALLDLGFVSISKGKRSFKNKDSRMKDGSYYDWNDEDNIQYSIATSLRMKDLRFWNSKNLNITKIEIFNILEEARINPKKDFRFKRGYGGILKKISDKEHILVSFYKNKEMIEELHDINKVWKLSKLENLYYNRIFGDSMEIGGRYYNSITFMKKINRKAMMEEIDYVEIDMTSAHFNFIWARVNNEKYKGDPYKDLLKETEKYINIGLTRSIIKNIVNTCINSKDRNQFRKSVQRQLLLNENVISTSATCWSHTDVILDCIERIFDKASKFFFSKSFEWCFKLESEIITEMMKLQIANDFLPITVHDSLYVHKDYKSKFESILFTYIDYYVMKIILFDNLDLFINNFNLLYILSLYNNINILYILKLWWVFFIFYYPIHFSRITIEDKIRAKNLNLRWRGKIFYRRKFKWKSKITNNYIIMN